MPEVVRYGPHAAQLLIGHRPASALAPVFVFVHGGGWVSGRPADYDHVGRRLAAAGWLTVCVGYRLAPACPWPAQLADVTAALAALAAQADPLGADPRRVVLGGHSAGAHLAALVALDSARWAGLTVRGFAGLSGVYDLERVAAVTWMRERWLLPTFGPDRERWRQASPVHLVPPDPLPCWLHNAEQDWGLHRHAAAFATALAAAGGEVERTTATERQHVSVIARFGEPGDDTAACLLSRLARWTAASGEDGAGRGRNTGADPDEGKS